MKSRGKLESIVVFDPEYHTGTLNIDKRYIWQLAQAGTFPAYCSILLGRITRLSVRLQCMMIELERHSPQRRS